MNTSPELQVCETKVRRQARRRASTAVPSWGEGVRGFPVPLAVSSLFSASSGPRKNFEEFTPIFSTPSFSILFRGQELREDSDRQVWCSLLHMCRGSRDITRKTPITVSFKASEMLKMLDWPDTSYYFDRLDQSLKRMHGAQIMLKAETATTRRTRSGYKLRTLLSEVDRIDPNEFSHASQYQIKINESAASLFDDGFIEIENKVSQKIRPVSRKIRDLLLSQNSHDGVYAVTLEHLRELVGSSNKNLASFGQSLKSSLQELKLNQIIAEFRIAGSAVLIATRPGASLDHISDINLVAHQPKTTTKGKTGHAQIAMF